MQLEQVVPWGRSASEYRRMFDLTNADLAGHILGCGDGPASFNAELTREGYQVTSIDPIYAFSRAEIRARVDATYESIIGQVKLRPERYVWREFADPDAIGATRLAVMENFLAIMRRARQQDVILKGHCRRCPLTVIALIWPSAHICSFSTLTTWMRPFTLRLYRRMLRVAGEVRIFPLLTLECVTSAHLAVVIEWCTRRGITLKSAGCLMSFRLAATECSRKATELKSFNKKGYLWKAIGLDCGLNIGGAVCLKMK